MIISHCPSKALNLALEDTDSLFGGNIRFREVVGLSLTGLRWRLTLTVDDSHGPGGRLSIYQPWHDWKQRHIKAACWHVHGMFFDRVLLHSPHAVIHARGSTIYKDATGNVIGNWQDCNIGSVMYPTMYSEACNCVASRTAQVLQSTLTTECWSIQAFGLQACTTCEFLNTEDCGGRDIRRNLYNERGHHIQFAGPIV